MAYDVQEFSVKGGRPYFLYQFARGAITTRFAAAPDVLTIGGYDWQPSSISHQELEQTGSVERSELELNLPLTDPFVIDLQAPQTNVMTLTIFRGHFSDATDELRQYWKGRVVGVTANNTQVDIKTENVFTSLRRPGCRVRVQRSCRHDLYGHGCNLNKDDWGIAATITAMSGLNMTVPVAAGYFDGKFTAGMVKWNNVFGYIQSHSSSTMQLISDIPGMDDAVLLGAQACVIYPGCLRGLRGTQNCEAFNNTLNYGGFRWIPSKNPFTTSLV